MPINTNSFTMQKIFDVDMFSLIDGSALARIGHLKKSTWANTGDIKYVQGAI